jgi:hypothetical protein
MRRPGAEEGGRRPGAAMELRRAIGRAGRRKTEVKRASDDNDLHTELLRRAGATERWRRARALRRRRRHELGFVKQKAAAAGLAGSRARGGVL